MKKNILTGWILLCLVASSAPAQENIRVLERWMKYTDASNSMYHYLSAGAAGFLESRKKEVEACTTPEQWKARQEKIRKILMGIAGPFPPKTPLNARITGKFRGDGFRVERILFESMPRYYVTAVLLIPGGVKGRAPAVIYCSGHNADGFRSPVYQNVMLNLVKKGFVVFAFDPVGQGERVQYPDPETGESLVGGPTLEHSYPGAQCFLSGSSIARYFVWDGIRAVDYLLTRREVDPGRIGITGRSGGGTQSAYIAAFDDRILAAAPECYITSLSRVLESIGLQDAEQNFYHGIESGIDLADLLEVRAPKPVMILATTRDFFSIQGVRETACEVGRVYGIFGRAERFSVAEDDTVHASTHKNREAMIAFFQLHLGLPGDSSEVASDPMPAEWLRVTDRGTARIQGSRTVFDLNQELTLPILERLDRNRLDPVSHLPKAIASAKKLSGYRHPSVQDDPVFTGRFLRRGYAVETYFMRGEGNTVIPFVYMKPEGTSLPALICLHPDGKSSSPVPGMEMESLVKAGFAVLAPDLLGTGETGPGRFQGDAYNFKPGRASFNIWFMAMQTGKSLTGIQAGQVARLVNWLGKKDEIDPGRITALAYGDMCPVLIHAAAFESAIKGIGLIEPLVSYRQLVMNRYYVPHYFLSAVPGAITAYDLPDLSASLAPRFQLLVNPVDQNGKPASGSLVGGEFSIIKDAYQRSGAPEKFRISSADASEIPSIIKAWLEGSVR